MCRTEKNMYDVLAELEGVGYTSAAQTFTQLKKNKSHGLTYVQLGRMRLHLNSDDMITLFERMVPSCAKYKEKILLRLDDIRAEQSRKRKRDEEGHPEEEDRQDGTSPALRMDKEHNAGPV